MEMEEEYSPIKITAWGILIVFISLLWTLVIPGVVAYAGGVFYREEMLDRLPPIAKTKLDSFTSQQNTRRQKIESIDTMIESSARAGSSTEQSSLWQLRDRLQKEYESAVPPVSAIPFYLNPQMLLWPAIYICLGWLLFLLKPPLPDGASRPQHYIKVLILGFSIYVLYEWPLWMRNIVLSSEGRTVFAYPNIDIHPASFVTQELVIIGFCFLLAALWYQWANSLRYRIAKLKVPAGNALKAALDPKRLEHFSESFVHWQICSITLALGFLFFTNFFWTLVARYNDQRYFLSALTAHLLWGISWIFISLPLIVTWRDWERTRMRALAALVSDAHVTKEKYEATKEVLAEMRPLNRISVSISGIGALVSFVLPFLQLFLD
jgi:hypothetical protein